MMINNGFIYSKLTKEQINRLSELARLARGDILKMTTLAKSGHPGGSMSSIDIYLTLYSCAKVYIDNPKHPERDRIIISNGHTSPGVYSALGRMQFFNIDSAIAYFRLAGSIFEGHIEPKVPGVEWATGNLGQGLSAGCGFALACKQKGIQNHIYVVMGDGEQQKGQISEARRFAIKYKLHNITVIIDYNKLQISGDINNVMPQHIKENYISDGWKVIEIDGHNFQEIYQALKQARDIKNAPVAILANTIMGKGVSFMENNAEYHGKALTEEQCENALAELNLRYDIDKYKKMRRQYALRITNDALPIIPTEEIKYHSPRQVNIINRITYQDKIDNRSAWGNALADISKMRKFQNRIAVFDCDLAGSVKLNNFIKDNKNEFYEVGIQEHNAATIAGVMSKEGILTFFADFGVFGVDETYNQQRLNDINNTNLKLITTHNGLDVGEDGKTHQCIDYIGLMNNLFGYKIIVPGDGNQTDIIIRYIAEQEGNYFVPMGRSKLPIIRTINDKIFYNGNYKFVYGKADKLRDGNDFALATYGTMVHKALDIADELKKQGIGLQVWNFSCLSDIDISALKEMAKTKCIFTYEDHHINTGLGSILANTLLSNNIFVPLMKFGVTKYGDSGTQDELYKIQHLDSEFIVNHIKGVERNA